MCLKRISLNATGPSRVIVALEYAKDTKLSSSPKFELVLRSSGDEKGTTLCFREKNLPSFFLRSRNFFNCFDDAKHTRQFLTKSFSEWTKGTGPSRDRKKEKKMENKLKCEKRGITRPAWTARFCFVSFQRFCTWVRYVPPDEDSEEIKDFFFCGHVNEIG